MSLGRMLSWYKMDRCTDDYFSVNVKTLFAMAIQIRGVGRCFVVCVCVCVGGGGGGGGGGSTSITWLPWQSVETAQFRQHNKLCKSSMTCKEITE